MKNFLIQESAFSNVPQISKRNEHTVEFIAVLQEANRPNRNGRIYRKEVLEQALAAPYVQERLRTNSFYSEAGHPMDTSVQRQMTIDQKNIACLIKEFWWEGDLLKARVETANTAIGRDMKGLIEQGSRVAFSLRAQGNVHHDPMLNATVVESPIQIATYDWVVNPSHDKAFLESICEDTKCGLFGNTQLTAPILAESVNFFENGSLVSLTETAEPVVVDYAKNFGLKVKPLSEAYIFEEGDVLTEAGKVATVVNENVTKKVVLEDFLLKDLRHRIARLTEEEEAKLGDEAAEPVHTEEAPEEHTPEVENADVFPAEEHQQAEEVEAVVVEGTEPHQEDQMLDSHGELVDVEDKVLPEVKDGEVVIPDHDHADKEGQEVRNALHEEELEVSKEEQPEVEESEEKTFEVKAVTQSGKEVELEVEATDVEDATDKAIDMLDVEAEDIKEVEEKEESEELPKELEDNTYDDPTDGDKIPEKLEKHVYSRKGEEYSKEELMEAFQALNLDTDKYTFEYLAEQLGFEAVFPSDEHMQEVDVKSQELGGEPSNERVAAQKPVKAGETVESSEEIKSEELGGEPSDARVESQKPAKAGETLHHAEEVEAPLVESVKVKLGNIKVKGGN